MAVWKAARFQVNWTKRTKENKCDFDANEKLQNLVMLSDLLGRATFRSEEIP